MFGAGSATINKEAGLGLLRLVTFQASDTPIVIECNAGLAAPFHRLASPYVSAIGHFGRSIVPLIPPAA